MLTSIHNLHFYLDLMREVREALEQGRFAAFRSQFEADRGAASSDHAVDALDQGPAVGAWSRWSCCSRNGAGRRCSARLAGWRGCPSSAQVERRIAALPPYAALAVFAAPALLLLPVKVFALWLIGRGEPVLGLLVILAAKVLGTAIVARLFVLTQPALMRLAWFEALYTRWVQWKDALLVRVRASWPWRAGRVLKRAVRRGGHAGRARRAEHVLGQQRLTASCSPSASPGRPAARPPTFSPTRQNMPRRNGLTIAVPLRRAKSTSPTGSAAPSAPRAPGAVSRIFMMPPLNGCSCRRA